MSKQSEETLERDRTQEQVDSEELVLPDESDRIIEDLKAQLKSLQGQLDGYWERDSDTSEKPAQDGTAGAGPVRLVPGGVDDWNTAFAPRIISRLQGPAEDLTGRLERLIEQVRDPELRRELEHCQQTAFYLFDTFRQISDNHRALMESLTEEQEMMETEVFRRALEGELAMQGSSVPVEMVAGLPEGPAVAQYAHTVVKILTRVAGQLIGEVKSVRVEPGAETAVKGAVCVTIACSGNREGLEDVTAPAEVVFKPGVSAITVVDWLYMEKIVELQDGSLSLYHEDGRAAGFRIVLPPAQTRSKKA